jgi:hypothetical protein
VPMQAGVLPVPMSAGVLPVPMQAGVLPVPMQTGVLPVPTQQTDIPVVPMSPVSAELYQVGRGVPFVFLLRFVTHSLCAAWLVPIHLNG